MLWTQIVWPLPPDVNQRNAALAHELFHRVQDRIAVPLQSEAANAHLDTLDGRYLMQLEWRALAAALRYTSRRACRRAITDALVFRAARYALFPSAAKDEKSLGLNEGVAEYTGISLGNETAAARVAAALRDLSAHIGDETIVRSFAYATGPAYCMLLDRYSPDWRQGLNSAPSLSELLQAKADIVLPQPVSVVALQYAERYGGVALRRVELEREQQRQQILAANRTKFVEGAVLVIPVHKANIQFNPRSLRPLDGEGTVYPTLRISAVWGVLDVHNGALLAPDWSTVTVAAPSHLSAPLQGDGWTLVLQPDWQIVPGKRSGDFALAGPTQ